MATRRDAESTVSSGQHSPPPAWHRLPTELFLEILNNLDSPQNLLSFISAEPFALSCYTGFRQSILGNWEKKLKNRLTDPALAPEHQSLAGEFEMAVRLRALRRRQEFYVEDAVHMVEDCYPEDKYKAAVQAIVETTTTGDKLPRSLGFLCELFSLISDADELISLYAPFEWSKQVVAAGFRATGAFVEPPPDAGQLSVTASERFKLYYAISFFENHSLGTNYCGTPMHMESGFFSILDCEMERLANLDNASTFVCDLLEHMTIQPGKYLDALGGEDDEVRGLLESATDQAQSMFNLGYLGTQGIHTLVRLIRCGPVRQKALGSLWTGHKFCYSLAMQPNPFFDMSSRYAYLDETPSVLWDEWRMTELQLRVDSLTNQESGSHV